MKNLKFAQMLLRYARREHAVLARIYSNGSWHQFSGKDVIGHIYLSTLYWSEILDLQSAVKKNSAPKTLIFITSNSYHSFVASFAAILSGIDILWLPSQMATEEIQNIISQFPSSVIVTDVDEFIPYWQKLNVPVVGIHHIIWMDREKIIEQNYDKFKTLLKGDFGAFHFISFQNEKIIQEKIEMNALVITAQNFIEHCNVPENITWQSFELMSLNHPFAHLSKFCCFLKKGIIGFPNYSSDLETSLSVLQPTFLFASKPELTQLASILTLSADQASSLIQGKIKIAVNKVQKFLGTSKAMKIPENVFSIMKRAVRKTCKAISPDNYVSNGLDNLQFIVHGFTSASKKNVNLFENYGIPVIETYGTMNAAGMLSSNSYHTPHLNIIGTPLSHVYFRLGAKSTLEYKISDASFGLEDKWHATGDVVQMTPFGFILTGQQKGYSAVWQNARNLSLVTNKDLNTLSA